MGIFWIELNRGPESALGPVEIPFRKRVVSRFVGLPRSEQSRADDTRCRLR